MTHGSMFHFFWSRHAFLVEPPHLQPPRPILPLSLSLFSFSLQFSPLVAANISPLGLVLARQPLAAIEAAMMGRQRSRKQRRSQLRSSSLIDLVRVFFFYFWPMLPSNLRRGFALVHHFFLALAAERRFFSVADYRNWSRFFAKKKKQEKGAVS